MYESIEPSDYYTPPEGEPLCPMCEGKEARLAVQTTIEDVLTEHGVGELRVSQLLAKHAFSDVLQWIDDEVRHICEKDGGRLCRYHYPDDSHEE